MKKRTNIIISTIILILFVVGLSFLCVPLFKDLKFGLDLQGGFEILYKAESIDKSKMTHEKLISTYKTLSKRIDSLGVNEPEITIEGKDKIRVKLAGVSNPDQAREQLSTVATLTFRDVDDNLLMKSDVLVSGGAKVGEDASGRPAVALSVKDKDKFFEVTNKVKDFGVNRNLIVIWLDFDENKNKYINESGACGSSSSNCLSAATVSQGFASDVIIQGNFSKDEVKNLVDLINSGSLPAKLKEVSSNTVGASFGERTLETTFIAGVVGVILIVLFLIAVYHFAGFISAIAMLIYAFLVFLIFWLVGGVLTLSGIAALVLGIGMAVDSNIIMFARIKDELYKGRSLNTAYKIGTKNSLSAILDANITTFIIALIMFYFGESSIKGFATMLIITIFVTMFTMVFLTRLLMKYFIKGGYFDNKTLLFINVPKEKIINVEKSKEEVYRPFKNINFFKSSRYFVLLSFAILIFGIGMFGFKGFNLGIDYKSGSNITIVSKKDIVEKYLRKDLEKLGLKDMEIIISKDETNVMVNKTLGAKEIKDINEKLVDKYDAKVNIGVVSNVVKKELVKNAIIAVLISLVGIIIYIALRFKMTYAISAVVALVHDVLIMFSFFAITRFEVSSMFIAAVLAIIGYSINDTIVLFDRFREELSKESKLTKDKIKVICNKAIGDTFSRTIFTTATTLISVVTLVIFASKEILNFNIAMLVGLIVGVYSSIYIATLLFVFLEQRDLDKPKKKKIIYTDEYEERKIKGINA